MHRDSGQAGASAGAELAGDTDEQHSQKRVVQVAHLPATCGQ